MRLRLQLTYNQIAYTGSSMLSVYVCAGPVHLSEPVDVALKGIYVPSVNTSSLLLSMGVLCMPFRATHHWLRELQRSCTVQRLRLRLPLPMGCIYSSQ